MLDERWTPWPLLFEPFHLVAAAVRVVVNPVRVFVEGFEIARAGVCEAADGDAADAVGPFRIIVFPGDVVARARREHVDIMLDHETFGDKTAEMFGPAEDLSAISP